MRTDEYEQVIQKVEHGFYRPGGEADMFAATLLARWLLERQHHEIVVIDTGSGLSERPRATGQPFNLKPLQHRRDLLSPSPPAIPSSPTSAVQGWLPNRSPKTSTAS